MNRTGGAATLLVAVIISACSSFGSDSSSPQGASVKCGTSTCTGAAGACCATADAKTCAESCTKDATIRCDDTADCAAQGLVCCIGFNSYPNSSVSLTSATCQSACKAPDSRRACDPAVASECGTGKGCIAMASAYANVYPSFPLFVCE